MNKVISVLQWLLGTATKISVWVFKIPVWPIKKIPGGQDFLDKLDGYKTVTANFCVIALAFMEGKNWIEIGTVFCEIVNYILSFFSKNYVCDPAWFGVLAAIFTAMLNLALRAATTKPISVEIMKK